MEKKCWVNSFRSMWPMMDLSFKQNDINRLTVLAVVHGIVERSDKCAIIRAHSWLLSACGQIRGNHFDMTPAILEKEARELQCGLHVFDPERDPIKVEGTFGVIQSVGDGIADISMYVRTTSFHSEVPIMEGIKVLIVDLPLHFTKPGIWVAWVERQYSDNPKSSTKGRYEPACMPEV